MKRGRSKKRYNLSVSDHGIRGTDCPFGLNQVEAALEAQREEEAKLAASRPPPPPPDDEHVGVAGTGSKSSRVAAKPSNGATPKKKASSRTLRQRETDWELDCEVCGETGKNVVSNFQLRFCYLFRILFVLQKESGDITCCDICGKWQQ